MSTALETDTTPWWEDGRNVTALARWYSDRSFDAPMQEVADTIIGIYETPWDYQSLWEECWSWLNPPAESV